MKPKTDQNPIRSARRQAGLTQAEVGHRLGVKRATVCGWEKGHYRPEPGRAMDLARMFPGLTVEEIYAPQSGARNTGQSGAAAS